jgi:hypothetical protein
MSYLTEPTCTVQGAGPCEVKQSGDGLFLHAQNESRLLFDDIFPCGVHNPTCHICMHTLHMTSRTLSVTGQATMLWVNW